MKASPTVIYDIGMSGMVTRPMGRTELRRYLDARYLCGRERRERCGGGAGRGGEGGLEVHIHNSFAGVSFTRLRLMEMRLY